MPAARISPAVRRQEAAIHRRVQAALHHDSKANSRYGILPADLRTRQKAPANQTLSATTAHPAEAIQGNSVMLHLPTGASARATAVGPYVPDSVQGSADPAHTRDVDTQIRPRARDNSSCAEHVHACRPAGNAAVTTPERPRRRPAAQGRTGRTSVYAPPLHRLRRRRQAAVFASWSVLAGRVGLRRRDRLNAAGGTTSSYRAPTDDLRSSDDDRSSTTRRGKVADSGRLARMGGV